MEDKASILTELHELSEATLNECATLPIEDVFMRCGVLWKIITDSGVSTAMQNALHCLGIKLPFIPMYHTTSNPVG